VVRIGTQMLSYWRIQPQAGTFGTSVAAGSRIDPLADPPLQAAARAVTDDFCRRTGLQLAGFDFIFDERRLAQGSIEPLLLEINYFFGRTGLGGSEGYYALLVQAIDTWLAGLGLDLRRRADTLAFFA
jgi:ribosomal protein S6--L-glutamate ligase